MTLLDAIKARHSVRKYKPNPLDPITIAQLEHDIEQYNRQHGLHIQLVTEEPEAFNSMLAHYGKFSGVRNYLALVGPKNNPKLAEFLGYCGEALVLKAQCLGLNSCWVFMTYSKRKAKIDIAPGEKLLCVITLGYGEDRGKPHKNKPATSLFTAPEPLPDWFIRGIKAARKAPTAMNQQRFHFTLLDNNRVKATASGPCAGLDLGIVKYHFEAGAGIENFIWE